MSGISKSAANRNPGSCALPSDLQTLVDVLQWPGKEHPHAPAFTFLRDGERDTQTLSYAALDLRAAQLAAKLESCGSHGEPVLLVFDPGVDYVIAFFACLYAGVIAVPVYPPDPFRLPRTLPRLQAIVENAGAQWMLTTGEMAQQTRLAQISGAKVLLLEEALAEGHAPLVRPVGAEGMALLQYTSGSTGTPRGVIVSHANLVHNFNAMHQMFDVEDAVVAHWLPPYHDMGLIGCLLLPIFSGRHTVAMSPLAFMQKPIRWLQAIDRYRATTSGAPNFGYELCVRKVRSEDCEGLDLRSWRVAVTGAEPVRAGTLEAFCDKFGPHGFRPETFLPAFGMAEATLIVSGERQDRPPRSESFDLAQLEANRVVEPAVGRPTRTLVGCGGPADKVSIRIVDPETRLGLAENEIGEIWLQSPGVGAGYWRDSQRTEEMFRATIANESADERYLRTGDMGFLRDGELFITGRRKELIILGGRNLYPLDLEQAVQASHPDLKVDGGAAFSIDLDGEEALVVVQEILRPKKNDLDSVLRGACEALLTEAGATPHALLLISAGSLPKTSSGKTRRGECRRQYLEGGLRVLAQWPLPEPEQTRNSTPPVTETELGLAPIWEEVLGIEGIGLEDDFFAMGAKSLRIAAMLGRVSDWLDMDIPLRVLFKHSTLQAFAAALDRMTAQREDSDQESSDARMKLTPALLDVAMPLTDAQKRFWFLERFGLTSDKQQGEPYQSTLHIPLRLTLTGDLNTAAVRQRLRDIVARHEMLRTRFEESNGQPFQRLQGHAEMPWLEVDFRNDPSAFTAWQRQLEDKPMDLKVAPLARAGLARLADDRWQLTIVLHHLIADGWSTGILVRELGEADLSPPLAAGYSSYASWRAEHEFPEQKRAYWQQRLGDAPKLMKLEASDSGQDGVGNCVAELDGPLTARVQHLARQFSATPFIVHLAALQAVLTRYIGSEDLVIGTVSANRKRPVLEGIVGCFINTVAMRCDTSGNPTFGELLKRVRRNAVADLEQADYPFERLVEDLQPPREPGRLPLVQSLLLLQDMPPFPQRIAGAKVARGEAGQAGLAEFDLALVLEPEAEGMLAKLHYRQRCVDSTVGERLLDTYLAVLDAASHRPQIRLSELPIPAKAERLELLVDKNATDRRVQNACPVSLLESQGLSNANGTAVRFEGESVTYRDLHAEANRVAHWLQKRGVGPDVPVGIKMNRSPAMVVAMLAVLKAGGAYVPMDPTHPVGRLQSIVDNCEPLLVIESSTCAATSGEPAGTSPFGDPLLAPSIISWEELRRKSTDEPATRLPTKASADHLAYIIYTSGTTGEPKGVMVTRKGVANFLNAFARSPGLTSRDRVLAHTTISFDISVLELFLPLAVGAQIVLAPCGASRDPRSLGELIERTGVTFLQATPSAFRMLRAAGWRPSSDMRLLSGGESLSTDVASYLLDSGASLWNVYGPTETTIWSTIHRVTKAEVLRCQQGGGSPSIGRPIDNTQVYVLDANHRPVPVGVVGDLYLGGAGVARGYWQQADLTEQRFIPHEFQEHPGRMMYRTGDRVRWRTDGNLEFRGRDDAQVKVRGFRVELGEVEAALLGCDEVSEAAVLCFSQSGDNEMSAFLVARSGAEIDLDAIRTQLETKLPHYMIPTNFRILAALPRSTAGKIDRKSLALSGVGRGPAKSSEGPRTPLEAEVARVWNDVLGHGDFGVQDRFFQVGGHSLKAITMLSRLESKFGVALNAQAFFESPTIEWTASQLFVAMASAHDELEQLLSQVEALPDDETEHANHDLGLGDGDDGDDASSTIDE